MINKHLEHIRHLEALLRAVDNSEISLDLLFPLKDSTSEGGDDDDGADDEGDEDDEDAENVEEEPEQPPEEDQGPYDLEEWQCLSFRAKIEAYIKNRAPESINWEGVCVCAASCTFVGFASLYQMLYMAEQTNL